MKYLLILLLAAGCGVKEELKPIHNEILLGIMKDTDAAPIKIGAGSLLGYADIAELIEMSGDGKYYHTINGVRNEVSKEQADSITASYNHQNP